MREQHGINLSYSKAYRSKNHAFRKAFGDPWESFKTLPQFFYMLKQFNPRTVTRIETDSENRFKYSFMALGASIKGFNAVIRPVIAIQATHLKAKSKGVLLVMVCNDRNNMIYHLAFGFIASECADSWAWFVQQLRKVIIYLERVLVVSYQHAGILAGMEATFPDAVHGFCAYHLAQNLKSYCKGRHDVISLYYHAVYEYRIEDFDHEMAQIKNTHCKVYDELLRIGVEKFSHVLSPIKRYHMMTTNIAESINFCILAIRKLPITYNVEFLQDLLQRWLHDCCTNARDMSTILTAVANKHIKQRISQSQRCEIHPIHFNRFKVDDKWDEAIVNLEERWYSCRA